jgi:hypothetical protein
VTTAADVDRVAALTERLLPLSNRQRGELIEAQDWNTVVAALLEVARALLGQRREGVPSHDHANAVKEAWLDPRLRSRLLRGAIADPASVARVATVERSVSQLTSRLDGVRADLVSARSAAHRVEISDLTRAATMTTLTRKVEGLGDARDDVADLRSTLDTLRDDLGRVTDLARDLEVAGEPVSLPALIDRIEGLEQLRARLAGPSGEELDATTFERRLSELANSLVTEEQLTEALATVQQGLPSTLREELLDDARTVAREQVTEAGADLERRLVGVVGERLEQVEAAATRAAATRAEEITIDVESRLRGELQSDIQAATGALDNVFGQRLDEAVGSVRGEIDQRLDTLAGEIGSRVENELARAAPALTAQLQSAVDTVAAEVASLADRVVTAERAGTAALADVARVRSDLEAADASLASLLRREIEAAVGRIHQDRVASEAQLRDQLRGEIAAERQRVDQAIGTLQSQLPRLVQEGVRAVRGELLQEVRTEVDRLRPELTTLIDRRLIDVQPNPFRPQ